MIVRVQRPHGFLGPDQCTEQRLPKHMWRDIFLENREAVLEMLGRFNEDLTALQRAIRRGDGNTLEELFKRTRDIRRGVIEADQA